MRSNLAHSCGFDWVLVVVVVSEESSSAPVVDFAPHFTIHLGRSFTPSSPFLNTVQKHAQTDTQDKINVYSAYHGTMEPSACSSG
jgi:hypothetical protein